MKRQLVLTALFWWMLSAASAQVAAPTDSIIQALNQRLLQGPVSPMLRVVQVREELGYDLQNNRTNRIPGLLDFLLHRIDPAEHLGRATTYEQALLLAAAGQFPQLLLQVRRTPFFLGSSCLVTEEEPPRDNLTLLAQHYVAAHNDDLLLAAKKAHLSAADSSFLPLLLRVLPYSHWSVPDGINSALLAYLGRNPTSVYRPIIEQYVRYEYLPSPFTVGGGVFAGSTVFTGELGQAFSNGPRFGFGLDGTWKRWQTHFAYGTGSTEPRQTYVFDGAVWSPDLSINHIQLEWGVGYCVLETRWLRVAPFAGLSLLYLTPYKVKDKVIRPEDDRRLWCAQPLTAGLNLELKLDKQQQFGPGANGDASWFIRLRGGWRQASLTAGPGAAGSVYFAELGIAGYIRGMGKRREP